MATPRRLLRARAEAAVASVVTVLPHEIPPLLSAAGTFFFVSLLSTHPSRAFLPIQQPLTRFLRRCGGRADPERLLRGAAAARRGRHLPGPRHPPEPFRRLPTPHRPRRPSRLPRLLPPVHPQAQGPSVLLTSLPHLGGFILFYWPGGEY